MITEKIDGPAFEAELRRHYNLVVHGPWVGEKERLQVILARHVTSSPVVLPLDAEVLHILGFLCMDCRPYAQMLRAEGVDIPAKAELEQAHVLHWMLNLYLAHGTEWRKFGGEQVQRHLAKHREKAP